MPKSHVSNVPHNKNVNKKEIHIAPHNLTNQILITDKSINFQTSQKT